MQLQRNTYILQYQTKSTHGFKMQHALHMSMSKGILPVRPRNVEWNIDFLKTRMKLSFERMFHTNI